MPFLHFSRPSGAHGWHPFRDAAELRDVAIRLAPHVPADATWDVTEDTEP